MSDQKQLFLFGQALPGNESGLLERMKECADKRNKSEQQVTAALQQIPADQIKQIAVGSTHVAFLFTDNTIGRLAFELVTNVVETSAAADKNEPSASSARNSGASSTDPVSAAAQAAVNAANRTAKIRRIMMTRPGVRSGGFCRTGVIIDRNRSNRPMIPASSVPEELIVQCQVVLQGKSRDVIVRELQRTNLNVNEAVNNLLSRDDDEMEDLDETGEAYLHEELLSLLDAGLRSDGDTDGYEYVISRDMARRRDDQKGKEGGKDGENNGQTVKEHFAFGDTLEYWGNKTETNFPMPDGVDKFTKIASMNAELVALADNGQLYAWAWANGSVPSNVPHVVNSQFATTENNKIVDIETCALRAIVLTQSGQVGSFMDTSCGRKLSDTFFEPLMDVPEPVERMFCCTLFSAILSKGGTLYWRGIFPFTERRKLWEKARMKKKQVTSASSNDIVVGSEVRTKSSPIYSVGSVAVNFAGGLPMIGTLYEDAWTLNETCRFRVQTPDNYDAIPIGNDKDKQQQQQQHREKRVSFSLAVGNRKRAAPTASDQQMMMMMMDEENEEGSNGVGGGSGGGGSGGVNNASSSSKQQQQQQPTSKESAWAIRDVVFIHEESVNDVSVVKIVDGAYCGVTFKSTLDRLEQEAAAAEGGGTTGASFDLSKLHIRLMRKDDLLPVTSASRAAAARSPENFQAQFRPVRLPSSVRRIISLAVDGTGFRILCVKNHERIHLIRVSCLGKLLSDHPMPFAHNALCQPTDDVVEQYLPAVNNYGDENMLLIRDSTGAFQPLLRNSVGGFQELSYTALGHFYLFGMGIRYLKSSSDVNLLSIGTEPASAISNNGAANASKVAAKAVVPPGQTGAKNVNRMMLVAALIAPTRHTTKPMIESLMQAILNCDLPSVRNILQKLSEEDVNSEERRRIACERIEGNRNIFHVAVMNAFAKTNREQADVEPTGGSDAADSAATALSKVSKWAEKWDSTEADAARIRKWQEMLTSNTGGGAAAAATAAAAGGGGGGSSAPTTRAKAAAAAAAAAANKDGVGGGKSSTTSSSVTDAAAGAATGGGGDTSGGDLWDAAISKGDEDNSAAAAAASASLSATSSPTKKIIPTTTKERQASAIDIVRELCRSGAVQEHFVLLMQQRDVHGQTAFQCAINFRAYTAALLLWETAVELREWSQDVIDIVAPIGVENSDESALFALCANDTCSYTWTGEEHTPQDIFECYACGLVETLCCCTECAYTCHRNHDCKIKKTSPTAYCDCWEKFGCRALITGNLVKREQLLNLFLQNGKLVGKLNARGEHLLLFLARTVGRQLFEQESYTKRTKRPVPPNNVLNAAGQRIPEHDLEPPKFARRALEISLSNWDVVKSLLDVGMKKPPADDVQISESAFHLGEQHGSTHLDKFVFTLLASCEESSLDTLLNLFIRHANRKAAKEPSAEVHTMISRFVRSVARLFVLVVLISPNAVRTLLATSTENIGRAFAPIDPTAMSESTTTTTTAAGAQQLQQQQQFVLSTSVPSIAVGGALSTPSSIRESVLSLVRASLPGLSGLGSASDKKDNKKKSAIAFVLKCRRVFQTLLTYSLHELIGLADTLVAPLRHGIVKPTNAMIANEDAIELIRKHLSTEQDLSSLLKEVVEGGGNLANMMMGSGGNSRIKKLVELRNSASRRRPTGTSAGGIGGGAAGVDGAMEHAAHSDDEMSNEEDEEDDEMENGGGAGSQAASSLYHHRARENSSTSMDRLQRERTASGGVGSGRRGGVGSSAAERSALAASAVAAASAAGDEDEEEEEAMGTNNEEEQEQQQDIGAVEDEHDEEDEDASEHEMEEDEEDEPYFDVHDDEDDDDDDDDEDDDDDDDDDASSNPSDAEAGDSNDTVPVIRTGGGGAQSTPSAAAAAAAAATTGNGGGTGTGAGDVRIELAQSAADAAAVDNFLATVDDDGGIGGVGGGAARGGQPTATGTAATTTAPSTGSSTNTNNNNIFLAGGNDQFDVTTTTTSTTTGTGSATNSNNNANAANSGGGAAGRTAPTGDRASAIDSAFREPALEGRALTHRLWRTSALAGAPPPTATNGTGGTSTPSSAITTSTTNAAAVNGIGAPPEAFIAEDYQYMQSNTSTQLALCFSILVKLCDELLVQLMCHAKWKEQMSRVKGIYTFLDIDTDNNKLYMELKNLMAENLEPTWNWLHVIMDRTEAQLKYSQAISQSIVGPMVSPWAGTERDETGGAQPTATGTTGGALGSTSTSTTTNAIDAQQQFPGGGQHRPISRHPGTGPSAGVAGGTGGATNTSIAAAAIAAATGADTAAAQQRRFRKKGDAGGGGGGGRKPPGASGSADSDVAEHGAARADFFAYFMSLMRSYSAESGDDSPVLEYTALRNVAFVAEAYFFHMIFGDQLKQLELEHGIGISDHDDDGADEVANDDEETPMEVDGISAKPNTSHVRKLRRFYRRSSSISYPTLSTAEQHHAFTFTAAEALPLAARSHLLSADAERNALFALPISDRSRAGHRAIATKLGVPYPTNQSLSRLPVQYGDILRRLSPTHRRDAHKQRSVSVTVKHFADDDDEHRRQSKQQQSTTPTSINDDILLNSQLGLDSTFQLYLGRWSNTVTMFARTYHEELTNRFGGDYSHSVLLNKTGVCSFAVRLLQFRKQMDKLKTVQAKDLIFSQMPREKYALVQHTFRQLNQAYVKRLHSAASSASANLSSSTVATAGAGGGGGAAESGGGTSSSSSTGTAVAPPLLTSHKVKVTFRDEPGEGTGVARHFYAALADAFTTIKHLPQLDNVYEDGTNRPTSLVPTADSSSSSSTPSSATGAGGQQASSTGGSGRSSTTPAKSVAQKARAIAAATAKIGGTGAGQQGQSSASGTAATTPAAAPIQISPDTQPLFYRTSKSGGFFTPIAGSNSPQRLNAFRNVGRIIGFCLQNTEIIPLPLCRHVLKFILNRPLNWFDLAFFDPSLFDSLRHIVYNEQTDAYHPSEFYEQLELTFSVDLPAEEGGGHIELKPDGANIAVTRDNVLEYICLFVEHRLLGNHRPCLEAIRRGVFDVLPSDALANLTSEDLRLILCGTQEFSIQLLQNFTKFLDESSAAPEVLAKYKKVFWSVVNRLNSAEKQELCFFWTGSPNLPSSEEGFRPLPTIMIRPADDQHLPTANTCISRLYLPIYSSKKLLRDKLSLAIKARNFGFV
ncbi:hypothetical protein niasHT_033592 [Heterodera trifolii]|uniref:E3 ubiquitin-protein ligase UBR5 n=1 Tax=Heterodera trifolii TaxID=157864 RepID=A0ABD2HVH2_9BILA